MHKIRLARSAAICLGLSVSSAGSSDGPLEYPVAAHEIELEPAGNELADGLLDALEKAHRFELLSLDPQRMREPSSSAFHGWEVLGSLVVSDRTARAQLIRALVVGVEESLSIVVACFNPRHGIRVGSGNRTTDFVICFECLRVRVYVDGKEIESFPTSGSPEKEFDEVLLDAAVPLAPKWE